MLIIKSNNCICFNGIDKFRGTTELKRSLPIFGNKLKRIRSRFFLFILASQASYIVDLRE